MGTSNYSERQHWLKIFPSIGKKCLYKIEPVLVYAIFHEIFVISLSFDYYFSFFPYRFKDVLPYDENRVKLAAGDKDNRNGYINASHVSGNKYICICTLGISKADFSSFRAHQNELGMTTLTRNS